MGVELLAVGVTVPAVVSRVVDGDTLDAHVDLGTKGTLGVALWAHDLPLRLARSNARELSQPGGPEARANLTAALPAGTAVTVYVTGHDKYAQRVDVEVYLAGGVDLIADLTAAGWLAPWNGRGVRPVPPWPRATTNPEGGS